MNTLSPTPSLSAIQHHTTIRNYLNLTLSTLKEEDEEGEECSLGTIFFLRFRQAVLWVSLLLTAATLIMIVGHRSLRKQHHIFPFNIVLADLLGIVTFLVYDFIHFLGIQVCYVPFQLS